MFCLPPSRLRAATRRVFPWFAGLGLLAALPVAPVAPVANAPGAGPGAGFSQPLLIDNLYMPLVPGRVLVYSGTSDGTAFEVVDEILHTTRRFVVNGVAVETVTQLETEYTDGKLTEISWNYFAQADDGTLHYFGEIVDEYEDGVLVSHDGSWLVGGPNGISDPADAVPALLPTVFMAASPRVGDTWKPDDLYPYLDETVTVKAMGKRVRVPAGVFANTLEVEETSEVDEDKPEAKWYAPGVGMVKSVGRANALDLTSAAQH